MGPGCPKHRKTHLLIQDQFRTFDAASYIDNWCLKEWPEAIRMFQEIARKTQLFFIKYSRVMFYYVQIL